MYHALNSSGAPSDPLIRTHHGIDLKPLWEEIICIDSSLMHYSHVLLDHHGVRGLPPGAPSGLAPLHRIPESCIILFNPCNLLLK